jgi:hypothetical protein
MINSKINYEINMIYPEAKFKSPNSRVGTVAERFPEDLIEFYSSFDVSKIELMSNYENFVFVEFDKLVKNESVDNDVDSECFVPCQKKKYLKGKRLNAEYLPENSIKIATGLGRASFYLDTDPDVHGMVGQIFYFDQEGVFLYVSNSIYGFINLYLGRIRCVLLRFANLPGDNLQLVVKRVSRSLFGEDYVKVSRNFPSAFMEHIEFRSRSCVSVDFSSELNFPEQNEIFSGLLIVEPNEGFCNFNIKIIASVRIAFIYLFTKKREAWDKEIDVAAFFVALEDCGIPNGNITLKDDDSAWAFLDKYEGRFLRSLDERSWDNIFGKSGLEFPRKTLLKKVLWGFEKFILPSK